MLGRIVLIMALAGTACGRATPSAPAGGLTDRQFIELYVALRNAHLNARTPQEFAQLEQQILTEARTSREGLEQFVDAHSRDLTYMAAVWDSVRARIDASPFSPSPR